MRRLIATLVPISERTQRRLFPVVAGIAGLCQVAGMVGPVLVRTERDEIVLVAFSTAALAHGLATQYLRWIQSWIKAEVKSVGLPEWVGAQAEKNLWKGGIYAGLGMPLALLVVWSGFQRPMSGPWLEGLFAVNLAFQVGAFAGEFIVINAQGRLFRDVHDWAKKPEVELANSEF
jgi:hypothetical protein